MRDASKLVEINYADRSRPVDPDRPNGPKGRRELLTITPVDIVFVAGEWELIADVGGEPRALRMGDIECWARPAEVGAEVACA